MIMQLQARVSPDPNRPLPDLRLPVNAERKKVVEWARQMIAEGCQIYDTETVGLANPEICELALVNLDSSGITVLMEERVKPVATEWEPKAIETHLITPDMVAGCRSFPAVWVDMLKHTSRTNHLISYSRQFDLRAIKASAWSHGIKLAFAESKSRPGTLVWTTGAGLRCALKAYATWVGQYKFKKNGERYKEPDYQKLPDYGYTAHSAIGDCMSTANLIQELAGVEI